MIILSVLLALLLIIVMLVLLGAGSFVLIFGDVLVFGGIIWLLIKLFGKKKKG